MGFLVFSSLCLVFMGFGKYTQNVGKGGKRVGDGLKPHIY